MSIVNIPFWVQGTCIMYGFIRCRPIYLFHVLVFYNATRDVFYYIMPSFIYAFLNKHKTNYKRRFIVILSVSHTYRKRRV